MHIENIENAENTNELQEILEIAMEDLNFTLKNDLGYKEQSEEESDPEVISILLAAEKKWFELEDNKK